MKRWTEPAFSLAIFCSISGQSAEPSLTPRGIGRLLPLESKELPVEFALQAIDEDGFSFVASKQDECQFEYAVRGKIPGEETYHTLGAVAEKRDSVFALSVRNRRGAVVGAYRNLRLFWLDDSAAWRHIDNGTWCFRFDSEHVDQPFDTPSLPPGADYDFSVDVPGAFHGIMEGQAKSARWDASSRTLTIVKASGTTAVLRFRSPDDQAKYGFLWSEAFIGNRWTQWTVRGFVNRRADFFTTTADGDEIREALGSAEADAYPADWAKVRAEKEEGYAAALKMEAALASEAYRRPKSVDLRDRLWTMLGFAQVVQKSIAAENKTMNWSIVAAGCTKLLRESADQLAAELPHFPDDPVLIRREAEARCGASLLDMLVRGLIVNLLNKEVTLREMRVDLCDALGDAGKPLGVNIDLPLEPVRKDPFLDAILRAHWLEPCGKDQIDACRKALRDAKEESGTEYVAAETLLRMDAWDEIPPAVAERWWKKFITDAAAAERTRSLTLVTQHARGRERLARQLKAGTLPKEVARDAAKALLRRVGAVEKTRRWESIDEETCRVWRKDFTPLAAD